MSVQPARPSDWKTFPLPAKRTTIRLNRTFSREEMKQIRQGVVPQQMEDKWFIYWQEDTLYFHRSWTGFCLYVVHFTTTEEGCRMTKAEVNRDPEQYGGIDDEKDAAIISWLIDLLLLHRRASSPFGEVPQEKGVLQEWHFVGRAMLGEHPPSVNHPLS